MDPALLIIQLFRWVLNVLMFCIFIISSGITVSILLITYCNDCLKSSDFGISIFICLCLVMIADVGTFTLRRSRDFFAVIDVKYNLILSNVIMSSSFEKNFFLILEICLSILFVCVL